MKTVSTLCATSTVGIAACGYALGRPREVPQQNPTTISSPLPLSSSPSSNNRNTDSPALSLEPPSTTSKKAWYRRFSESLSSIANSSYSACPPTTSSSISSRIRSPSSVAVETPTSRSPTRNKLVKRSNSRSISANLTLASRIPKRPSTALPGRISLFPYRSSLRPSTSLPAVYHHHHHYIYRPYDPKAVSSWRKFFTPKIHSSRRLSIKRVYPNCYKQPTLVLGSTISHDPFDTDSICSVQSIYYETRPTTPIEPSALAENDPLASPPTAEQVGRPFSLSNFLPSPASRLPSRSDQRHSSASAPLSPYYMLPDSPSTAMPSENRAESRQTAHLPPIQSLSSLNIDTLSVSSATPSRNDSAVLEPPEVGNSELGQFVSNSHLSILMGGGSERASTLIGSDIDEGELVLPEPSETVFDSVRTRVNDGVTPVRVESLFDYNSSPPASPLVIKQRNSIPYADEIDIDSISPTRNDFRGLTSPPVKIEGWDTGKAGSNRSSWDSDWDSPGQPRLDENNSTKSSSLLRFKPCGSSRVRGFTSTDDGSRSSIEDWNDSFSHDENVPIKHSSSPANLRQLPASWRPKTSHAKVTPNIPCTLGNITGSTPLHSRSQSLPARTNPNRAAVSENWDEDFADDGFGGLGCGVVVPKAIQEHQKTVLRHLDSVKEFASLVEELKRLRQIAISNGARWGASRWLWDEADGVIALASTDAVDEEIGAMRHGGPRHKLSKLSSLSDEFSEDECGIRLKEKLKRRTSVLLPDDDIFGGGPLSLEKCETPLKPRSLNTTSSNHSSPNRSRRTSFNDRSDPIALARSMMEKVQRDGPASLGASPTSPASTKAKEGGVHFDTRMLGPLLEKVRKLLESLQVSLQEAEGEFGLGPYSRISVDSIVQVKDSFEFGVDCRTAEVRVI